MFTGRIDGYAGVVDQIEPVRSRIENQCLIGVKTAKNILVFAPEQLLQKQIFRYANGVESF